MHAHSLIKIMCSTVEFPFDITDLPETDNKELLNYFHGERTGFVHVGPNKYVMPSKYRHFAEEIYNLQPRADDVWIITHPRSGTTVLQEMLWLLIHDLNFQAAKNTPLDEKSPFLEYFVSVHDEFRNEMLQLAKGNKDLEEIVKSHGRYSIPIINALTSPRVIKTHLPLSLVHPNLLNTTKVVYVARNPKDVAVSYYHLNRAEKPLGYVGNFPKFWDFFQRELLPYAPHLSHVHEAWNVTNHQNMLFLFYEDMVKDMKGTIRKVAKHLEKNLSEHQVDEFAKHLHIDNFRKHMDPQDVIDIFSVPGEQGFVRNGRNNDWVEYFTPDMNEQADGYIREKINAITGFKFPDL